MFAAPQTQTASSTISTLCSRLSSATLLEDRRGAILGLRSFAKEFPASVASGSLRDLISSLSRDGEDVDTVKVVLETLLMLFNPNEQSPEASDEIVLWMADEFTQRQDNITVLLALLEPTDFYSRLYTLQLLSSILAARTERTEECIFTAPLGITRLVAVLDDSRDAIRNEGLSLLTYLTPTSPELQKLVAFENAFDRIFNIIQIEGALSQGGSAVEDCLILLANLLRLNASNQSFFRETGCVQQLTRLLTDANKTTEEEEMADWAKSQRNRNIYALLAVLRLFLVEGGPGCVVNQASFWQHGVLHQVLELAFARSTEIPIKAEALITCADLIKGNSNLQESFAQLQVPAVFDASSQPDGHQQQVNGASRVYVIDALLDLMLGVPSLSAFDARLAACECIKAYFFKHSGIRLHFLGRAIDGHLSGADDKTHALTTNVLTTLLRPPENSSTDPYRLWLAAIVMLHLVHDDLEAKTLVMSVTEGDAASGEEVVTCIQMITANLVTAIQRDEDNRILVGYLMLLCVWLFEDFDGVSDFLGEGSNIHTLIHSILRGGAEKNIVQGLAAFLLGTVYEFSTKDSPVSRSTLHEILVSRLGRNQYVDRLAALRSDTLVRDFEVLPRKLNPATGSLPEVYFDRTFVDFFKDNYSRILRALDRDPGFEVGVVANGVQKGISREMVDSLQARLDEKEATTQRLQSELLSAEKRLTQEVADHQRTKESTSVDVSRLRRENEALLRSHAAELSQIRSEHLSNGESLKNSHAKEVGKMREEHSAAIENLQRQLQHVKRSAEGELERQKRKTDAELSKLKSTISQLETVIEQEKQSHAEGVNTVHKEYESKLETQSSKLRDAEGQLIALEARARAALATSAGDAEKIKLADERLVALEAKLKVAEALVTKLKADSKAAEAATADHQRQSKLAEEKFADLESKHQSATQTVQGVEAKTKAAEKKAANLEAQLKTAMEKTTKAEKDLAEKEEERKSAQSELEDLLMVISDLEEKAKQYKSRLEALGETVSDAEDGEDDDDDDDSDDVD